MSVRNVRKNLSLMVDGKGYAGQIDSFNAPRLRWQTESFRAGGMEAPVEMAMGLEKLSCDFSLISYDADVLAAFGVKEGGKTRLVVREALESFDGTVTPVVHTMQGRIRSIDPGVSKPGEKPLLKVEMALVYYQLKHGDQVVIDIDVENMVRVINGVDMLQPTRDALGI